MPEGEGNTGQTLMAHKRTHNKTHRGHRTTMTDAPRPIKLANGRLSHGQYFTTEEKPMDNSQKGAMLRAMKVGELPAARARAPSAGELARASGAAKRIAKAEPAPGMVRQTSDAFYTGPGQSHLNDEPNLPIKSHIKPVAIHDGMTHEQRAKIDWANDPKNVLDDAARLGRSK
jgi:hypothetical protein